MSPTQKTAPKPPQTPILGSFRPFVANPPEFLSRLANEYGGLVNFNMLQFNAFLVSDPDLIREVLVTRVDEFPKDRRDLDILIRFLGHGLVTAMGADHTRQRKMAQPAFHARRIAAYGEAMTDYAADLARSWQPGEARNMSHEMEQLTMYIVTKTLFDIDKEALTGRVAIIGEAIANLQKLSNDAFQNPLPLPKWLPTRHNRQVQTNRAILDETIQNLITTRRAEAGETLEDRGDLLSMFLQAQYDDGTALTDEEVRDQLVTLFIAGHETTSNALTWTWYLLAQHPEVEQKLQVELSEVLAGRPPTVADLPQLVYTEMVIKEAMRIFPPVWGLSGRTAVADTELGGYGIPRGSLLFLSPYANHHNSRFFPEPEKFDPERFTPEREASLPRYAYFPFGGGPRVCIGNTFAMMEAQLLLATLAQHHAFSLVPGQQIEPLPLITLSPKFGLYMRAEKRLERPAAAQAAAGPI